MGSIRWTLSVPALALAAMAALAQPAPAPAPGEAALTLGEARALALRDNPGLRAAEAGWRASQGAARQAGSLLNPSLELAREDFGGGGVAEQRAPQESLALSQTLRIGGKRQAAREAAGSASEAALEEVRLVRLEVLAQVDRDFADLLGAQERARIAAEDAGTALEMVRAVEALVEAGEVSPIEVSRAQNEADLAQVDLRAAERGVETARVRLARTLGQQSPRFSRAGGELLQEVPVPEEAEVLGRLQGLPDLTRWDAETRRLDAELSLAKRAPLPDPTLSFGMRRYTTTGEKAYFAGIALPLPLFDQNRGAVIEASSRLDQGRLARRAEELRLRTEAAEALSALSRAAAEVGALRGHIVPGAERIYGAVNEGYLRGKFGLLDLLEARRSLASSRVRLVDALVALNQAKADLDRLTATPPPDPNGATP